MFKLNKSFSKRLSLHFIFETSILLIIIITVSAIVSQRLIVKEIKRSAESLLDATILSVENTLQDIELSVKGAAWVVTENRHDVDHAYHITKQIVENNVNIVGSTVAYSENFFPGRHSYSPYSCNVNNKWDQKDLAQSYDYFKTEWFRVAFDTKKPHWTEPYFDEGGGNIFMSTYSLPLKDERDSVFAVFTADVGLEWLENKTKAIKPYKSSRVLIVSPGGNLLNGGGIPVFSQEKDMFVVDGKMTPIPQSASEAFANGEKGGLKYYDGDVTRFMVFGPLKSGGTVIITSDYDEMVSSLRHLHILIILIAIVGLVALFIITYFIVRKQTRILSKISKSALSIADGNFHTELPEIKTEDEIRNLRDSFEYMQNSINDYIEQLETTTAAKHRYESELSIAQEIQSQMLPKQLPQSDRFDVYAIMQPARQVGGDLYDFHVHGDDLYFAIGDVSGKGVSAAMYMAITRSALRIFSDQEQSISELVRKLNKTLTSSNDSNMFVTLFVGKVNLVTGDFVYCNGGHNPGIVIDGEPSSAHFMELVPNIAAGLFDDFTYQMQSGKLNHGSRLIFYTDGVTEAEKANQEQFGDERLLNWASHYQFTTAQNTCQDLLSEVQAFTGGAEQNDDITILVIEIK